jgi:hypothetical protein
MTIAQYHEPEIKSVLMYNEKWLNVLLKKEAGG